MPYKLFFLAFFMFVLNIPCAYSAIPIQQATVERGAKQGKPIKRKRQKRQRVKNPNINGLLSLIFGVASLMFPLFAIPAIVLGIISLTNKEPKIWMGLVGLITGSLVLLASLAILAFFLLVFL